MLTKPLAHLRPLLRLPSQNSLPADFFTSNPSVLHHLHPNNAIVPSGQSSAQAAGSAGNAGASGAGTGRTGWGAGTGSGSGYTGHARAFLSLQSTSSIDPATVLSSNSEENRSRKQSILSQHRLNRRTQVVDIETETVGRTVHRQIEARTGGLVDVVEIEGKNDETRMLESAGRGRRRGSIAFPTTPATQPRIASSVRSRPSASVRPSERTLARSQSSLDIWHVGMPQSRLSIRAMSTSSPTIPLPEVDEVEAPIIMRDAPPSTRIIGQPNRVLMDLAGIDLPGRPARSSRVRRNSTAAIQQSEAIPDLGAHLDDIPYEKIPSSSRSGKADLDKQFFTKLYAKLNSRSLHSFHHLVEVYRSPRTPENIAQLRADPDLADCPIPDGYSTATYNLCLEGLLVNRKTGESIAPMLEIYNEMLDNNCIPNYKTYSAIIRALSDREIDVWRASERAERELKWSRWEAGVLERQFDEEAASHQMSAIEGYQSEGNFASALKLVQASALTPKTSLLPAAYLRLLLAAEARKCTAEDLEQIREALNVAQKSRPIAGHRQWHGHLMAIYARAGDVEALKSEWNAYLELDAQDSQGDSRDLAAKWLEYDVKTVTPKEEAGIQSRRLVTWESAARAFAAAGEIDTAEEIWAQLLSASQHTESSPRTMPVPNTSANLRFAVELCKADIERGVAFFDHIVFQASKVEPVNVPLGYLRPFVQLLIEANRFDVVHQIASTPHLVKDFDASLLRTVYLYALQTARTQPQRTNEALQIIALGSAAQLLPFHLDTLRMHAEVAIGSQNVDNLPTVFLPYLTNGHYKTILDEEAPIFDSIVKVMLTAAPLSLPLALTILEKANAISEISVDESIPTLIGRLYLETKSQVAEGDLQSALSADNFENVIGYVSSYPVDDGEMDDVLVTVAQDLQTAADPKTGFMADRVDRPAMRLFAQKLSTRVGKERTMELLSPSLGAERVEEWISQQNRSDTPGLSDGETGSEASLPSLPEHAPTTTPPTRPFNVSHALSQIIDRHTLRNSNITPEVAYNKLKEVMATRHEVPHPDIIARLFDNLSRIPDEEKTREMYSLAHYVIQTSLPAQERALSWLKVEDAMLIAACHLGRLEEAGMYRARILQAGMVPSADAYATMIACSKDTTDDALVARELYEESRGMGIVPNLFLYNTIISKLSKARKAEMALELFKNMKEAGVRPSSVTYGAVINACCRVGDGESATVLFEEMSSQRGFRPRVPPFNTMMQFHLTTQPSRERVLHYYNLLCSFRVPPSAHTYKLLLDAYAVLQPIDLPAMERVFNDICGDSAVRVQGTHWASLISAYGISGNDLDKSLQLFESIPNHPRARVDLRAEPVVWEAVLNVVAQKGSVEQMESIRNRMIQLGARSTAYVHNVLITGYARAGLADKAREVFAAMGDSVTGVAAPNNHPQLLTSSGHVKPSTVTDRPTEIVYREPSTYESMIRAELSFGDVAAAEAVMAKMAERRYPAAVFMRARHILDDYLVHHPKSGKAGGDVFANDAAWGVFTPMEEPPSQTGTYREAEKTEVQQPQETQESRESQESIEKKE